MILDSINYYIGLLLTICRQKQYENNKLSGRLSLYLNPNKYHDFLP